MESRKPTIYSNIDLENIISRLLETRHNSEKKDFPRAPIMEADYQFAKRIIERCYMQNLRPDNFCINLTGINIQDWTKEQYRAFGKLFASFSEEASLLLKHIQNNNLDMSTPDVLFLQLPRQNANNFKIVNGITKTVLNHGFVLTTGNENALTLSRWINTQKRNPLTPYKKISYSVSVVLVTENDKVLLLKRKGLSGRAGTWGTLTGKIDQGDSSRKYALIREVHEEINLLLVDHHAHYVGSVHTQNLSKDLAEKGKIVTYADDCSYVYGILIPEQELVSSIKLDSENSDWRLFTREELNAQFKINSPEVHGPDSNKNEMHVALGKSLMVLDAAKNNFENVYEGKINYPYTNSPGFFAGYKSNSVTGYTEIKTSSLTPKSGKTIS